MNRRLARLLCVAIVGLGVGHAARGQHDPGPGLFDGFRTDPAWSPSATTERPASHDAMWEVAHGAAANGPGADCASCHTETSCASCHAAANVPSAVHPAGYVLLHAGDATADSASCTSCHTPTRFCLSCHIESDLSGEPDRRPPAWAAVHPPGWLDPGSLTHHGAEARADLLSCASCHSGRECATCHIDINPHGVEFRSRCAPMLRSARPTCAQCHTTGSPTPLDALGDHPSCQ